MAASILDAFVVTLGLDNRDFRKGEQQTEADLKRVREAGNKTANELEASGKRAAEFFTSLRNEVVGLFFAFAGAKGLKDFASDIIAGDAATGRLAGNLGIATEKLSAWEGAITRVGGKAGDADAALQAMVGAFQSYKLTGTTGHDADFQGLGVSLRDLSDPANALLKMAEAGERLGKPEFVARLQRIGIPEATINLLEKGRRGVAEMLAEQEKLGVTTDKDAASSQAFQDSMAKLTLALRGAARPAVEALTGAFNALAADKEGLDSFFKGVGDGLHRISIGFQIVRASLSDFVTIWNQLKSGDYAGALQTFMHGSVEDVQNGNGAISAGGVAGATAGGIVGGAGLSGAFAALAGRIRGSESRGNYDQVVYGLHAPRALTSMTLGEVFDWQRTGLRAQTRGRRGAGDIGSTGVGAYQFESQTLAHVATALFGSGWRSQSFSRDIQDRLAERLYNTVKGNPAALRATWAVFRRPLVAGSASHAAANTNTTHIGSINVHTAATDAHGIARDLPAALRARGLVVQAQSGMVP